MFNVKKIINFFLFLMVFSSFGCSSTNERSGFFYMGMYPFYPLIPLDLSMFLMPIDFELLDIEEVNGKLKWSNEKYLKYEEENMSHGLSFIKMGYPIGTDIESIVNDWSSPYIDCERNNASTICKFNMTTELRTGFLGNDGCMSKISTDIEITLIGYKELEDIFLRRKTTFIDC